MSDKKLTVAFRRAEIDQLLSALGDVESSGHYYGVRKHFVKRHNDIKSKLFAALRASGIECEDDGGGA